MRGRRPVVRSGSSEPGLSLKEAWQRRGRKGMVVLGAAGIPEGMLTWGEPGAGLCRAGLGAGNRAGGTELAAVHQGSRR